MMRRKQNLIDAIQLQLTVIQIYNFQLLKSIGVSLASCMIQFTVAKWNFTLKNFLYAKNFRFLLSRLRRTTNRAHCSDHQMQLLSTLQTASNIFTWWTFTFRNKSIFIVNKFLNIFFSVLLCGLTVWISCKKLLSFIM